MRTCLVGVICLLLACETPSAEEVSPVQKVIELLGNLKNEVKSDLDKEASAMEEYMKYCDMEAKDTKFAIRTAQRDIEDVGAVVEDSVAAISKYEDEISSTSSNIAMKETEAAEAAQIRKIERSDFQDAERQLLDTIDEMSRATVTIKKEMSFIQASGKKGASRPSEHDLQGMMNAFTKVVTAEWVDAGSKRRLTKFIQAQEAAGTEDQLSMEASMKALRSAPPQGTSSNYESHSGGIMETITDMGEKAQESLSEVRKKELKTQHTYDMLKMQLTDQMTLLKNKLSDATLRKSAAAEAEAKARGEAAGMKKSLQADQEYLTSLNTECSEKQSSWEERQASSADEIAAIEKASEILASGVKGAFVQESGGPRESRRREAKRSELSTLLRELAKKFNSYALMSMASAAANDPFAKVKGLIEDMVTRLLNEANEEATHKSFCDEELSKSKKTKEESMAAMDEFTSRSDKASSMIATREEKVKVLQSEVSDIDAAQRESAKVRQEEKANFLKTNKEYTDAAQAVSQAIQVLKDYYESGAALAQVSASSQKERRSVSGGRQPEFGGAKHDAGGSIISILEMAEGDFTKLVAEGQTQENQAVEAFRKLADEDTLAKQVKLTEVKGLQSEVKSLEVNLVHYKEDQSTATKEFDAVMDYLDKLRPECETKVMSYEERKARREAEIEGLKEALSIIEGEGIVMNFLQRGSGLVHMHQA